MNRANLFFEVIVVRCQSGGDALRIGWSSTATLLLLGEENAAPHVGGGSSGGGCASACGSAGASWAIGMGREGRLRRFGPALGAEGAPYGGESILITATFGHFVFCANPANNLTCSLPLIYFCF